MCNGNAQPVHTQRDNFGWLSLVLWSTHKSLLNAREMKSWENILACMECNRYVWIAGSVSSFLPVSACVCRSPCSKMLVSWHRVSRPSSINTTLATKFSQSGRSESHASRLKQIVCGGIRNIAWSYILAALWKQETLTFDKFFCRMAFRGRLFCFRREAWLLSRLRQPFCLVLWRLRFPNNLACSHDLP